MSQTPQAINAGIGRDLALTRIRVVVWMKQIADGQRPEPIPLVLDSRSEDVAGGCSLPAFDESATEFSFDSDDAFLFGFFAGLPLLAEVAPSANAATVDSSRSPVAFQSFANRQRSCVPEGKPRRRCSHSAFTVQV